MSVIAVTTRNCYVYIVYCMYASGASKTINNDYKQLSKSSNY